MSKRICSIDGCTTKVHARGWCNLHYRRWERNGDPVMLERIADRDEAVLSRLVPDGDCLVWTLHTNDEGYGRFRLNNRMVLVHRYVWEKEYGPVPDGKWIDHRCHNPLCSKVTHLRLVTRKQNLENSHGARVDSTSGYRGVIWDPRSKKYQARATHNGKRHVAGYFKDIEEANQAVIALRNKLFTHNDVDRGRSLAA